MILNLGSLAFNADIQTGGGTPAWGTELGQGEGYKFFFEDMSDFFTGMVYKSISDIENVTCPLGKGGNQRADYEFVIASIFDKVFVNGRRVKDARFLLLIVKKIHGEHHVGRRTIKYNPRMTYCNELINEDCYKKMVSTLGFPEDAAWFVHEILIKNQDELHFTAYVLGQEPQSYSSNDERRNAFLSKLPKEGKLDNYISPQSNNPLQQIYFGTPGSGKSFIIKKEYEMTKVGGEWIEDVEKKRRVIRTTFHPDTDYASFVGCYKPISYDVENEKKIKYDFVPQAFTEAYVKAWNDLDSQYYLVLEEINRGNCAQIFGDLFQLLDRKSDGSSEYPIKADTDLRKYLEEAKDDNNNDILLNKEGIRDGKLCLPPNLNIIASMNTSDQSLFPMDSAFKRRWSWEYVPIDYNNIKSGLFTIKIGSMTYLWHEFLKKINQKIKKVTSSEDKQMGNFFIKQSVDEKEFKDKVMFYLWSEVGKDNYQTKDAIFHCYKPGTTDEQEFSYNELYPFGTSKLQQFMSILGVEPLSTEDLNEIEEESNESSCQKNFDKFSINGSGEYNKRIVAYEAVLLYVNNHPNETAQTIVDTWMALDFKVPNFIETSLTHEQRQLMSKDKLFDERSRQMELPNGEVVYISKNYTLERIQDFIEKVNAQDWNIHIEKI